MYKVSSKKSTAGNVVTSHNDKTETNQFLSCNDWKFKS